MTDNIFISISQAKTVKDRQLFPEGYTYKHNVYIIVWNNGGNYKNSLLLLYVWWIHELSIEYSTDMKDERC